MVTVAARILLGIFYANFGVCLIVKEPAFSENMERCDGLAKDPYFDIELVVGEPWRVYYSWIAKMETKCLDLTFRNATSTLISRIYNDMSDYLQTQPNWNAATLHLTVGRAKHELLLLADQGPAGNFIGVPDVVRDGNMSPGRHGVPVLRFFLKLLGDGNYLLMSDCNTGVTTLSSRDRPTQPQFAELVDSLQLESGEAACITYGKTEELM